MKTDLVATPVVFRSQAPKRVLQEFFGLLTAYNLLCAAMTEAAVRAGISPLTISFVDAVERIQRATLTFASASTRELPYLYRELLASPRNARPPSKRSGRSDLELNFLALPLGHRAAQRHLQAIGGWIREERRSRRAKEMGAFLDTALAGAAVALLVGFVLGQRFVPPRSLPRQRCRRTSSTRLGQGRLARLREGDAVLCAALVATRSFAAEAVAISDA